MPTIQGHYFQDQEAELNYLIERNKHQTARQEEEVEENVPKKKKKEQNKTPEKVLSEMKISNLIAEEFIVMITEMLTELGENKRSQGGLQQRDRKYKNGPVRAG